MNLPSRSTTARKPKYMFWAVSIGMCLAIPWLSRGLWLPWLYTYLDVAQPPRQADYAVVLGGSCGPRAAAAADLYADTYVPNIVVSGLGGCLESDLEELAEAGVPSTAISVITPPGDSTWEEAEKVLAFLEETEATSALVVTQGHHTRRVQWTYRRLAREQVVDLTIVATAEDYFPTDTWWQTEWGRHFIRREYAKLIFYHLYYGTYAHQAVRQARSAA